MPYEAIKAMVDKGINLKADIAALTSILRFTLSKYDDEIEKCLGPK